MNSKQTPTYEEAIILVRIKRIRAKKAMGEIVEKWGIIGHHPVPSIDLLLEYLSNMVYALELLMKVLADDWRVPGETRFSHRVGKMYEEIFSKQHVSPDLMTTLEAAIRDQKFLLQPSNGLAQRIPEIEALWEEIASHFYQTWQGKKVFQMYKVTPSTDVLTFLETNFDFFVPEEPQPFSSPSGVDERKSILRQQIAYLQSVLAQLDSCENDEDESPDQVLQTMVQKRQEQIKAALSCFRFRKEHGDKFDFSQCGLTFISDRCLER